MPAEYLLANQPDILEVIANLSNDAVFTPPRVVNAVLDLLPDEVWSDPTLRWLDPGSKTGVFPREITKRLMAGLVDAIPDEEARLAHILTEMVFAIATEEITGMMTRRSLYCSKDASSEFAAVRFAHPDGNVWQKRVEHSFNDKGVCSECKGAREDLEKEGRDNKAYGFIHTDGRSKIDKEMAMRFDVIVGNPPYQMGSGGDGTNATPLYDVFVQQAKALNPRYLAMIIPSRWMAGGMGLQEFRATMLADRSMRIIVDIPNAMDVFPGVEIQSGVCYFLWDRDKKGLCEVTMVRGDEKVGPVLRDLNEFDVFVRDSRGIEVLRKVLASGGDSFTELVSSVSPFGIASNFRGYRKGKAQSGDLVLHMIENQKRVEQYVPIDAVTRGVKLIRSWKVFVPEGYNGGTNLPHRIIGPSFIGQKNSICSHSYLAVGPLDTRETAESVLSYLNTRFVRFVISLRKISQHTNQSTFSWVPQQTWDRTWTDAELYEKYGITADEQAYIETMVKEIEA